MLSGLRPLATGPLVTGKTATAGEIMSRWLTPLDNYCERTGPEFWSEPINAVTNAAFVIAAYLAWREARRLGKDDPLILGLCGLVAVIGIGSFLFHSFAQRWSLMADVIPIQIFILAALAATLNRVFGLSWKVAGLATLGAALVVGFAGGWLRTLTGGALNGSEGYLPPLFALIVTSGILISRGNPAGRLLGAAALVFTVSLTFRTLDRSICEAFPLGTHWLWHALNAVTLWLVLVTIIRFGRRPAAP